MTDENKASELVPFEHPNKKVMVPTPKPNKRGKKNIQTDPTTVVEALKEKVETTEELKELVAAVDELNKVFEQPIMEVKLVHTTTSDVTPTAAFDETTIETGVEEVLDDGSVCPPCGQFPYPPSTPVEDTKAIEEPPGTVLSEPVFQPMSPADQEMFKSLSAEPVVWTQDQEESFKQAVEETFKTLTVEPIIEPVVEPEPEVIPPPAPKVDKSADVHPHPQKMGKINQNAAWKHFRGMSRKPILPAGG